MNAWIATGGAAVARILATKDGGDTWNAYDTPLVSSPSAGGVSVAFRDSQHGIVGGGDLASNASADTATSDDGGQTWTLTNKPPTQGAIFCLAYVRGIRHGEDEEFLKSTGIIVSEVNVLHAAQPKRNRAISLYDGDDGFLSSNAKETSSVTLVELTEVGGRKTNMRGQLAKAPSTAWSQR